MFRNLLSNASGGLLIIFAGIVLVFNTPRTMQAINIVDESEHIVYLAVIYKSGAKSTPDKLIAFQSNQEGNSEIYVIKEDGSGLRNITDSLSSEDTAPAWSPDGSKIVFVSDRNGSTDLYTMNADGSQVVQLTSNSEIEGNPAWSPDGQKIAFHAAASDTDNARILVMDADGMNTIPLTDTYSGVEPDWSPDGEQIVYYSYRNSDFEIYRMNADGTNKKQLTQTTEFNVNPAWSPKGDRIAFAAGSIGASPLYIHLINPDGSGLQQLTTGDKKNSDSSPAWSGDGKRMAYTHCELGTYCGIFTMDADGSNAVELTRVDAGILIWRAAWQP